MSTSPINPMPFAGAQSDGDNDPDLATPDVGMRPDDDSPLVETGQPEPDADTDEDPNDQLLRDPEA